jgi:uncharacterized protein (TIGR02172 family)
MNLDNQTRIAQGATAEVFTWGEGKVLKLYRPGYPADEAEREARRTRAVAATGLRIPAVIELVMLEARSGVVFERVEGTTMLEVVLAQPDQCGRIAEEMAKLHASMHACEASSLPLQREALQQKIRSAHLLTDEAKDRALMALDRLPDGQALCHGDFHPSNVLMTERGPVIIDWVDATQGHPLADVTRTRLLLLHSSLPDSLSEAQRRRIAALRLQFWDAYRRQYALCRSYHPEELDAWMLPVAAARLSEAVSGEEAGALVNLVNA